MTNNAQHIVQEGMKLLEGREYVQAANLIKDNFELVKLYADTHLILGLEAFNNHQYDHAIKCFTNAIKIHPQHFFAMHMMGICYMRLHNTLRAIDTFTNVLDIKRDHVDARYQLAVCLKQASRFDESLDMFHKLAKLKPDHPHVNTHLASLYEAQGDNETANQYYHEGLKLNPFNAGILFSLAKSEPFDAESDVMRNLHTICEKLKDQKQNPSYVMACFGLAGAYAKNKDHDTSFDYYHEGNSAQAATWPYEPERIEKFLHTIKTNFRKEYTDTLSNAGHDDDTPIFIVGMPRSGTSLTEQILASHPQVHGAGELEAMRDKVLRNIPTVTGKNFPHDFEKLTSKHFTDYGKAYLEMLKSYAPQGTKRIVDKMPSNRLHVGLIRAMLPKAKIIMCHRDPMDICWSIWRQLYYDKRFSFKTTFEALGHFCAHNIKLMRYWCELYGDAIYPLHYEALVDQPEEQIRQLLNFCNLEWNDDCLNFHKSKNVMHTASVQQVRKPLYKDAVKSWEPVRNRLAPLQEALKKYGAYENNG